jgi:hypothetical protein
VSALPVPLVVLKVCYCSRKRQSYLSKGKELLKQGKKSEAHDCFQKCVDISPEMALSFIKVCADSLLVNALVSLTSHTFREVWSQCGV